MPFTLIQHPDLEHLAHLLARQLAQRDEALAPAPLIVQTSGMAKWVALECARHNGAFSRVQTFTPHQFIMKLGFLALGQREDRTVFEKDVLPWALYRILEQELSTGAPELSELAHYVRDSEEEASVRLFALATTLADLFDQYLLYRPQWLETWELHGPVLDLPDRPEQRWQAFLWNKLQVLAGDTATRADFYQRLQKRIREDELPAIVPRRVILFGMSLLPPRFLQVFALLGERIEVTLYWQLPSLQYWGDLESDRQLRREGRLGTGNRLLANLGRTGQEFLDLLLSANPDTPDTWDESEFVRPLEPTLLQGLQHDILWCLDPRQQPASVTDRESIRVARCVTPLREIEVLHDLLLDALADLPDLRPTDILVVAPDLSRYAPLFDQVFEIPFSISDQSAISEDRRLRLITDLLAASEGAFSPAQLVPLFEEASELIGEPLDSRARERVARWCRDAGIRRGWTGAELSWQAGLDRLFAGYALDGTQPSERDEFPLSPGWGEEALLLGRLSAFVSALAELSALTEGRHALSQWLALVMPPLGRLLEAGDEAEEGTWAVVESASRRLSERLTLAGLPEADLSWALFHHSLLQELAAPAASTSGLTGRLTVAGMVPFRSLPFRVIAVVGMHQGAFPRASEQPEYDLMRGNPQPGDRDVTNSDRYLFLELLTSARDRFLVTASGREDDDEPSPLSSTVENLLTWLDREYQVGDQPAGRAVTVVYPLSPGSSRYRSLEPSQALLSTWNADWFSVRPSPPVSRPFWDWRASQEPPEDGLIDGRVLLSRLTDPLVSFWERGLQALPRRRSEELPETERFELDGLGEWAVRDAVLAQAKGGDPWAVERLRASGGLPPGEVGRFLAGAEERSLGSRIARAVTELGVEPVYQQVRLEGRVGALPVVWETLLARAGDRQVLLDAGRINPRRRLMLALTHAVSNLSAPTTTILVALDATITLAPCSVEHAGQNLLAWHELARRTLIEPLPFTLDAVAAWQASAEKPEETRWNAVWKVLLKAREHDRWLDRALGEAAHWDELGQKARFLTCVASLEGVALC